MNELKKMMRGVFLTGHGDFDKLEIRDDIPVPIPGSYDVLIRVGADKILLREDSIVQTLGRNSIDVVIDLVAGEQWPELLDVLRPLGRYAVAGAIGGPFVEFDVRTLYLKDLSLFGCTILEREVFSNLIKHIEKDEISPIVAKTFPLSQIAEAQKYFITKKHTGKIVLTLRDDE